MKDPDLVTPSSVTFIPIATGEAILSSRVRILAWWVLIFSGLIEASFSRHAMQSDGISYLDMGDAIVGGDWKMAVNGIWSPLYPCLLGLALRLVKPSAYWEFAVVHVVNLLIYVFALGCFDFLLRAAVADRPQLGDAAAASSPLPRWALFAVGYSVFLWSSLSLITLERVSPDLLMAGFLYLAVGLLLQSWERPQRSSRLLLLGAVLGLGYLAKAPVFPLAPLFFAISWILADDKRRATPRVLAAVAVFLAISGPWIVALSHVKGRFTYGDSARFNYVAHVNDASPSWYFQNLGTATGHYVHPPRKIFDAPPIYEFGTPLKGTIPIWYDPSYWAEGAVPRVFLTRQLQVIRRWVTVYLEMLFTEQGALFVGFIVLCFMGGRSLFLKQMKARWPVWLIGLSGLGMYVFVLVDPRYVAVFFTLLWVGLYSGIALPSGREGQRLVSLVTLAVVIAMASPTAVSTLGHLGSVLKGQPNDQWVVAEDLRKLGVTAGDRVARIGGRYDVGWARLLRVTVVAEIPHKNSKEFWCGKPEVQAQVIETFRRLGVTAIVAEHYPLSDVYTPGPEWRKLGDGTYHALWIAPVSVR